MRAFFLKKLPLVLGGLAAAAGLLELSLRLFPTQDLQVNNPYRYTKIHGIVAWGRPLHFYREIYPLEHDPRAYYRESRGEIDYFTDQWGGRWKEPKPRRLGGRVAVVLGDSITYGFGLRHADSLPHQLSLRMPGWDFVNLAQPTADALKALAIYREKKAKLPHQLLIYGLHLNDLVQFPTSHVITNPLLGLPAARHSRLADFVFRKWHAWFERGRRIREISSPEALERPFFRDNFAAVLKMRDLAEAAHIPFVVVLIPVFVDLDRQPFGPAFSSIRQRLADARVQVVDLTESFRNGRDSDYWITPFDQHPNEAAQRIFASAIAERLGTIPGLR